ncbi:hypothetical protein F-S17_0395 [Faustovirus]|nr:hypothetical protein F-LCD7_0398 [Faustovirus]QJX72166.1 hypothetical protein F-M6_0403 [Faustovirus]QJX72661.1 hypothetical protein F-S17_0395 [Faustovirus]QJX73158.1 hypothetical protein F-VV57_0397 [Faustovirus]QJX73665.1 hypothetical protein F-VV63_0399 [Faustovirus]
MSAEHEQEHNEYLQRFDTMGTRMEELALAFGRIKEAKGKGIATRIEHVEHALDIMFNQLKDIHETLIDLNNNFVDSSPADDTHN